MHSQKMGRDQRRWWKVVQGTCLGAVAGLMTITASAGSDAAPLMTNGGFEDGVADWSFPNYSPWHLEVVGDNPREGKACLRFESLSDGWSSFARHKLIPVPSNTTVTVSGWVRSDGPDVIVQGSRRDAAGKALGSEIEYGSLKATRDAASLSYWVYFEKKVETKDAAALEFLMRLHGEGKVYFDGFAVTLGGPADEKAGNYLRNSGFSICSTPGYPNWWGPSSTMPFEAPDWETGHYYGVDPDAESPVPGAKVLRIKGDGKSRRIYPSA